MDFALDCRGIHSASVLVHGNAPNRLALISFNDISSNKMIETVFYYFKVKFFPPVFGAQSKKMTKLNSSTEFWTKILEP